MNELDLAFRPVKNAAPARLTEAQIAQYNRLGFVASLEALRREEIGRVRAYVDGLLAAKGADGDYGINCYQARLAGLWDIATHPRILDPVEDLVGPDIVCWASAILCKRPGDARRVPWHQDASFWKLSPARTVTVWLAIDDVDEENSAMLWIPGTHDKGMLPVEESGADSVFHKQTANAESLGTPVADVLRAGQMSLHADMIVHGSEPNRSDRRRCGLTLRYCPPDVRIVDEEWARGVEAILCRGKDSTGSWRHFPRPENDDITRTSSPHVVGNN